VNNRINGLKEFLNQKLNADLTWTVLRGKIAGLPYLRFTYHPAIKLVANLV